MLLGRPALWGLAAYGAEGVQTVVELIQTGFARDTVRKSIAALVEEGRLYIVRGLGTFVSGG